MSRFNYVLLCLLFLNITGEAAYSQTDASIKAAKKTVTDAKTVSKFIDNDSVHWLFGGDAALSFKATSISGGEDQIAMSPIVNMFLNYKKNKLTFENYLTVAYGFLKTGERKAVKSDDRLNYISKAGYMILPKLYYTAALVTRTQFTPGYKADTIRISDFMAPAYMFVSIGLDYRPNKSFSMVLSPVMGKTTIVNSGDMTVLSNAGMVTVEKDETGKEIKVPHRSRHEFGGGALLSLNGNLFKNKVTYNSQVDLFSNYMQKPENIDIYWTLQTKIFLYKNISADIRLDLKYDDDQKSIGDDGTLGGPKIQVKNFLGLGLFYQF